MTAQFAAQETLFHKAERKQSVIRAFTVMVKDTFPHVSVTGFTSSPPLLNISVYLLYPEHGSITLYYCCFTTSTTEVCASDHQPSHELQ